MILVSVLIRSKLKCGLKTRLVVKLDLAQNVARLLKKMEGVLICIVILVILIFVGLVALHQMDGFINYK